MNNEGNNERDNNEFIMFLRTILTVLENHNFRTTTQVFKDECFRLGYDELLTDHKGSNTSNPKIILENFSNTQPYRIIVENFSKTKQESSKPNLDYNLPNIPINSNPDITITECTPTKGNSVSDNSAQTNFSDNTVNENFVSQQFNHFRSKTSTPETAVLSDYSVLKRRFSNLQIEHQKLMDVVTELTFALQTSIKGQIDETKIILNNCERMYPELFCKKPLTKSSEIVIVKTITTQETEKIVREVEPNNKPIHNDIDASDDEITNLYRPRFSLDYQKIKYDLKNSDLPTKILLLQALRWRITKTSDTIRESVVRGYVRHDILNIHTCTQKSSSNFPKNSIVFSSFYCSCSSPQPLQQSVARFVNALASMKIGRDYIVLQSIILNILLTVLLGAQSSDQIMDDITRDMIIATLQKVSLRYSVRMLIISEGLTEYITEFLVSNYKNLNEYCLEYSIALLRNLWLHNEAREKCQIQAHDILNLLANLLQEQYHFCLPYITGSLYNLLPDSRFNKAAKEINLEEFIVDRIKTLQGELKEQLQYILEIYLNPDSWQPLCECDLGTDSENEIDIVEPEIDQNEDQSDVVVETDGENFLYSYRRAYSIDASNISPTCINNMFSAPVTPSLNSLPPKPNKLVIEETPQILSTQINNKILNVANENAYIALLPKEENIGNDIKKEAINSDFEMTFCEDTQQMCYVPSKNGIFEPDKTYSLHTYSPSFIKNIGEYDLKNISNSVPVSPRNKNNEKTYSPTYTGTCYREGFQPKSFSDNSTPHIGFCNDVTKSTNNNNTSSKYSCACLLEMQKSFEEDKKLTNKNNNEKSNNNANAEKEMTDTGASNYCKYKCYPTSNSAPTSSAPKMDRDTGTSKSLDEMDYTAVFESRPKILRTP